MIKRYICLIIILEEKIEFSFIYCLALFDTFLCLKIKVIINNAKSCNITKNMAINCMLIDNWMNMNKNKSNEQNISKQIIRQK